jgi:hypothetical protein
MRPWPITSSGPNRTVPPASPIAAALASTSVPVRYVVQYAIGGAPSWVGPRPATRRPLMSAMWS